MSVPPVHSDTEVRLDLEGARRIAAVCRDAEAARTHQTISERLGDARRADVLWLTWVQWRALGREGMVRETNLSLWTITYRLRQLREFGIPIPTWSQELDLIARGRFLIA